MNYTEALDYIHSVSWKGSRPGLERISTLCKKLGNPEKESRFLHIAGTNGKGSVSKMLAEILLAEGYSVGLYTSPFIESFNERIMYNGKNISDADLAAVTEYVKPFADQMEDIPTEFELITAVAFEYFKRKKCDFVVLEAGLGGRLDSTNVIESPALSIITGIALDHMAILGNTVSAIAKEKAGIIKSGRPTIFGEGSEEAEKVIIERANALRSPFYRTPFEKIQHIRSDLQSTSFDFDGKSFKIRLHGLYQTRNAATVLTACNILRQQNVRLSDESIAQGLWNTEWKARFEVLCKSPLIVYDGAHNVQGIESAVENIRYYLTPLSADRRINIVMGVMKDKAYAEMIDLLTPYANRVYCVTPENDRSLDAVCEAEEYRARGVNAKGFSNIAEGVQAAFLDSCTENRPLICLGSLYMYADVRKAVRECERSFL